MSPRVPPARDAHERGAHQSSVPHGRGGRQRRHAFGRRRRTVRRSLCEDMVLRPHPTPRGRGDGGTRERDDGRDLDRGRASSPDERLEESERAADVGGTAKPLPPAALGRSLLQTGGQRTPRAKDQRLDRRLRELQLVGDLAVREPLPLAQENRTALALGHVLQHVLEPDQLVRDLLLRRHDLLQHLHVVRRLDPPPPPGRAPPREADVVGDLEHPGLLDFGDDPAREAAEGVHERRLDGVLGLLARTELVEAVAEDLRRVTLVEIAGRLGAGGGGPLDPTRTTYGRNSSQGRPPGETTARPAPPRRALSQFERAFETMQVPREGETRVDLGDCEGAAELAAQADEQGLERGPWAEVEPLVPAPGGAG